MLMAVELVAFGPYDAACWAAAEGLRLRLFLIIPTHSWGWG
jgi:hypothetical protein